MGGQKSIGGGGSGRRKRIRVGIQSREVEVGSLRPAFGSSLLWIICKTEPESEPKKTKLENVMM
eukprot:9456699-Pyramimonas_sp.AAC.1